MKKYPIIFPKTVMIDFSKAKQEQEEHQTHNTVF